MTSQLHASGIDGTPVIVQDQSQYIQHSINDLVCEALLGAGFAIILIFGFGGNTNNIQVTVQGNNYDVVSQVAQDLTMQIAGIQYVANVKNDVVNAKTEVVVAMDAGKAISAGTTPAQISSPVRQVLSTTQLGNVVIDGKAYQLTEQVTGALTSVNALGQIPLGAAAIPLSQLAIVGVLVALTLTGKTLGLPALIGLLMLIGIVVTNAIMLLELVLDLLRQGMPLDDALIQGG